MHVKNNPFKEDKYIKNITITFTGTFATTISFLLWRVQVLFLMRFDRRHNWFLLF